MAYLDSVADGDIAVVFPSGRRLGCRHTISDRRRVVGNFTPGAHSISVGGACFSNFVGTDW